jgi:TonB family protein
MTVNSLFSFAYESGICLASLFFIYWIFLRKETYFQFNRMFLLGSIALSCLIPFGNFGLFDANSPAVIAGIGEAVTLPEVTITMGSKNISGLSGYWQYPLLVVYLIGVVLVLVRLVSGIVKVNHLRKQGKTIKFTSHSIVYINQDLAPFSFFKNIFINETLSESSKKRFIIDHELIHIRQFHTIDNIVVEIFLAFFWFNPIPWLIRTSLRNTHEYLADRGVRNTSESLVKYQSQLLQQIGGLSPLSVANNFNSMIKNRIIMMVHGKSSVLAKFKTVMILPVILLLVLIFACTKSENEMLTDINVDDETEILKSEAIDETLNEELFFIVEEMPSFQGQGQEGFQSYLSQNLRYPKIANKNGISGRVYVQFVVNSKGNVVDAVVIRGIDPALDKEAVRLVMSSPSWAPGKQRGNNVKVQFTFPIDFVLD